MKWFALSMTALAFLAVAGTVRAAPGGAKDLVPTRAWAGSVDDEALQKHAPADGFVTDRKVFAQLWREWKVGSKVAAVDFKKELVLVQTTKGSLLEVIPRLGSDGDLKVLSMGTNDFLPGFRYRIVVIPRAGIKTVDGKELPKGA